MDTVNWSYLAKAIEFYKGLGYKYVEVPWFVPLDVSMITCPAKEYAYEIKHGDALVGSAEQSLMHMSIRGDLLPGRYVTCSPCFRDEPVDDLHKKQFMKVELFDSINVDPTYNAVDEHPHVGIMGASEHAMSFFETFGLQRGWANDLTFVEVDNGCDIEWHGVELGSYGQRDYEYQGQRYSHIYGTGLAEPRFSKMLQTVVQTKLKY